MARTRRICSSAVGWRCSRKRKKERIAANRIFRVSGELTRTYSTYSRNAREGGRQGSVFYLQIRVARTITLATGGAMIVGAVESQRAQHTDHVLGSARDITRLVPARTKNCPHFTGKIGVETLLNGVGREPQSTLAQSDF